MRETLSIPCPFCGQSFEVACGPTDGDSEFITDCEVCCRPMAVTVRAEGGEIEVVSVQPA